MPKKKVAYLIGAGATHAEVANATHSPDELYFDKFGVLISHVSKRVMRAAQSRNGFKKGVESVTAPEGSTNIELLISLLATNRVHDGELKVKLLKDLVEDDLTTRLTKTKKRKFYLHKALLELHNEIEQEEFLMALISLNYDDVLDDAYTSVLQSNPEYCFTSSTEKGKTYLLKLHGSFNWTNKTIYGKKKSFPIMPLGIHKNYLAPPYNFIWGQAFETLANCDVLRIIGCALNQNDIGLIDLLFKAHIERDSPLTIEIIDFEDVGESIQSTYGFFRGISKASEIEKALIPEVLRRPMNPFKVWLQAKARRMLSEDRLMKTKYLKKVVDI